MRFFLLILGLFLCKVSSAQKSDNLSALSDHNQIQWYYSQAAGFIHQDSAQAYKLTFQGIDLALSQGDELLKLRGDLQLAEFDSHFNQNKSALERILKVVHQGDILLHEDSVKVFSMLSSTMSRLGAYKMSIEYKKKLLEIRGLTTGPDVYYPLDNIAYDFLKLEVYDSANVYYGKACRVAKEMDDLSVLMHSYNNVGHGYYKQEKYQQAFESYKKGLKEFEGQAFHKPNDSILYAMLWRNIGIAYLAQKQSVLAIENLKNSSKFFIQCNQHGFLARNFLLTAEALIQLKKAEDAKAYIDLAFASLDNNDDRLQFYKVESDYYTLTGAYQKANESLKKYLSLDKKVRDQQTVKENISEIIDLQTSRIKNELELSRQLINKEKAMNRIEKKWWLIATGLGAIILLVLFMKYQSGRRRKEALLKAETLLSQERLRIQELEKERLEQTLKHKDKDLTDFAIDITRKHEFIEEMLKKLNKLKKSENDIEELKETINFVKAELSIDNNLKLFQENIDQVHHEFIQTLESKFPTLTKSEKQICGLLRLNLSSKEIATVKGISYDSIKTMRSRIRKKLNMSSDQDLSNFLKNLS